MRSLDQILIELCRLTHLALIRNGYYIALYLFPLIFDGYVGEVAKCALRFAYLHDNKDVICDFTLTKPSNETASFFVFFRSTSIRIAVDSESSG